MQDEPQILVEPQLVPWTGTEIVLSIFLAMFFWPAAAHSTLSGIGFYRWFYGEEQATMAVAEDESQDGDARQQIRIRMSMWAQALALPFQVLTFPFLFAVLSGTRPEQLGLTTRRLGRSVFSGIAAMLVVAPLVFGIYFLLRYLDAQTGGGGIEKHELEKIAAEHLSTAEWMLLVFTAMIAAPLREELIFRGVLQQWLSARRWGGHAAVLGSFGLAVAYRWKRLIAAWPEGIHPFVSAAAPALFVLGLVPIYLLVWRHSRTPSGPAIFGTALLFAWVHTLVWPTPVPLFVLGIGLGVLAYRTRSLVGPIVLHSLFNGVGCVQLLLGW
jgi:membrane protease YdiL (CAAX protease family)